MKRIVTLSLVIVFGTLAAGSAWAKSGSSHGSNNHSSSMHSSSQHINSNHSKSDYCKEHCDKDHCDKAHGDKDYCKDKSNPYGNMGGSLGSPVGTPENPYPVSTTKFPVNTIHPIVNNNPAQTGGLTKTVGHLPISAISADPNLLKGASTLPANGTYSNGFVWVGDHWERPRAGQSMPGHGNTNTDIPVRDHSHDPGYTAGGAIDGTHHDVTGEGDSPVDAMAGAIGGAVADIAGFVGSGFGLLGGQNFNEGTPYHNGPVDHRHP
jgi:hypothetical protein